MTPLSHPFELLIIQHPNEVARATNTGKLLQWRMGRCHTEVWSRAKPSESLLSKIEQHPNPILLFPTPQSKELAEEAWEALEPLYIVLDSTWQEAQKMWRQSPWLQRLATYHLSIAQESAFTLRRNQRPNSLCTCEIGVELLSAHNCPQQAQSLSDSMQRYFAAFQADRSGHALNP
jgi:DTW domain-containing protein YfiP